MMAVSRAASSAETMVDGKVACLAVLTAAMMVVTKVELSVEMLGRDMERRKVGH